MASFGMAGGPALFIFANLNGTISAWNGSNINSRDAKRRDVVGTTPGALYTGLAINSAGNLLYAANGAGPAPSMSSTARSLRRPSRRICDPTLPAGFVPFNVKDIGGKVYVAYAPAGHASQTGATAGMGAVAVFDESGELPAESRVAAASSPRPWGMAIAPAGFGPFGGDLLVGNFSFADSEINAFNATTGKFEGTIDVNPGAGNTPGGLWDLMFGGGGTAGDPTTLFFTDGINGETDGLFGVDNRSRAIDLGHDAGRIWRTRALGRAAAARAVAIG